MKMVLLPGMDGTGDLFQPFLNAVPKHWEILVIRYPSIGAQDYTTLSDYVARQLPMNEPMILIAESFSGPIAFELALSGRFQVDIIIFVASFLTSPRPNLLGLKHVIPLRFLLRLRAPVWFTKRFLLGQSASDQLIALFWQSITKTGIDTILHRFDAIASLQISERRLDLPCVYLQADNDWVVPERSVDDFQRCCTNLHVVEVPGTHFLLQSSPNLCAQVIVKAIAEMDLPVEKL